MEVNNLPCATTLHPNIAIVSIGIPTYNRCALLIKAIESVLNQNYRHIELIVSDNASTDQTFAFCKSLTQQEKRVIYMRQSHNLGPTVNFVEVLRNATGQFFMWLGDDDWLDPSYISNCLDFLLAHPDYSLACGRSKYYRNGDLLDEGVKMNLSQDSPASRLRSFYWRVADNGTFHGVMRREHLSRISFQNSLGNDWHIIAAMAFLGKIKTIEDVSIHRGLGGATDSYRRIASSLSLPRFEGVFPNLSIALNAFWEISGKIPVFHSLSRVKRYLLGLQAFAIIYTRKVLIVKPARLIKKCFGRKNTNANCV